MAEMVACLRRGRVEVLRRGQPPQLLESPHRERLAVGPDGDTQVRIVSVTRGRTSAELCYAVVSRGTCRVYAQIPGSAKEQLLFQSTDSQLSELDFSAADEALACTVAGDNGTSAIGVFANDGRGLRTVTEGDVIDRAPRWAPGARGEIVYASAGIGRTKAGKAVGRTPFALHRLRFSDNSVEVLMADARYDYAAAIPVSEHLLYALRQSYAAPSPSTPLAGILGAFRGLFSVAAGAARAPTRLYELVRVTPQGSQLVARDVLAFDVAANEDVIYSNEAGVFTIAAQRTVPEPLASLERVEQLVICP